jgi:hypothetical protein
MRTHDDEGEPIYMVGDAEAWEACSNPRFLEYARSAAPDVNWNNMTSTQHMLAAQRCIQTQVVSNANTPTMHNTTPFGFELAKMHLMAAQVKATFESQPPF